MKRFVDTVTVLLLAVSFGIAFYTGFIGKNSYGDSMLAINLFSLISIAGVIVLFIIGAFSTVVTRAQMGLLTVGGLIFGIAQFVCVVGVCVIMTMLWTGMFSIESTALRLLYLLFVGVVLAGYVDSLLFADSLAKRAQFDYDEADIGYLEPQASIAPANADGYDGGEE